MRKSTPVNRSKRSKVERALSCPVIYRKDSFGNAVRPSSSSVAVRTDWTLLEQAGTGLRRSYPPEPILGVTRRKNLARNAELLCRLCLFRAVFLQTLNHA